MKTMKKRKKTGELELFKTIWAEKKRWACQNCNKPLGSQMSVGYMSHIIPKGKAPELRLERENIKVVCFPCHNLYEFGTLDKLKDFKLTDEQWAYMEKHNYLRYCKLKGI
jgi:5-methylcytosine-specific restriction endonuclease McrA